MATDDRHTHPYRPRVLIVDDDTAIREVLRILLEEEGYAVIEAPDGVVALDILRALPYGVVVLSNHNMPRLDGPGLFSHVLNDPELACRHAYIYMTAASRLVTAALQRQLEELGARQVPKPFTLDGLLEAVEQAASQLAPPRPRREVIGADKGADGDPASADPVGAR